MGKRGEIEPPDISLATIEALARKENPNELSNHKYEWVFLYQFGEMRNVVSLVEMDAIWLIIVIQ